MKKISCHRNLNLAKRNPRKFVWILGKSPNKNGDFAPTTKPKKIAEVHDGAFMLKNAVLHVNMTGARKINNGAHREVCAYARGVLVPNVSPRTDGRRITINMIQRGKADKITGGIGQGESQFVFADTREPCPTSDLTIYADSTGMYLVGGQS
tara:strand:+ start:756 stop:1211 length:456 start_codon:yes stop_codon:yes gene_type:complete